MTGLQDQQITMIKIDKDKDKDKDSIISDKAKFIMNISVREPIYVLYENREYVIRPGTVGVDKNKVVFFYDCTRTSAVGFPRDYCFNNPQTFHVVRELSDVEVSKKDVIGVFALCMEGKCSLEDAYERIKSL